MEIFCCHQLKTDHAGGGSSTKQPTIGSRTVKDKDKTTKQPNVLVNVQMKRQLQAQFTPPAGRDKTVLSVSCLVCQCEMDDCAKRVQTSSFLSATVFSRRESNSHRRSRHHTCLAWRCELALMLPHYFADAILQKLCHLQV